MLILIDVYDSGTACLDWGLMRWKAGGSLGIKGVRELKDYGILEEVVDRRNTSSQSRRGTVGCMDVELYRPFPHSSSRLPSTQLNKLYRRGNESMLSLD